MRELDAVEARGAREAGQGRRSRRWSPRSARGWPSASSAIRRYVVSLPPATLSIPLGPTREDRLAPRRSPSPHRRSGKHAQTGERRANASRTSSADVDGDRRLGEHLLDVRVRDAHLSGVALEQRVGRAEQEHPLPRHGEGDTNAVVRDRQRGRPRLRRARARGRPCSGGRTSPHADPRSGARASTHGPAALTTTGSRARRRPSPRPPGSVATLWLRATNSASLRTVAPGLRGRADVREAEPAVVRPRVGVEAARAQVVGAQRRHHAARALGVDEPVQPRPGEGRVEDDPGLHDGGPVRAAAVEREQEREAPNEVRRHDVRSARAARGAPREPGRTSPSRR